MVFLQLLRLYTFQATKMANVGVEALLTWLDSLELTGQPLQIDDLQDGTYLLKVIYIEK